MIYLRYAHPKHTIFAVFFRTKHLLKIFEEDSTYEAILFHILCEFILYSQMFFKCIVNQGVTLKEGILGIKGLNKNNDLKTILVLILALPMLRLFSF